MTTTKYTAKTDEKHDLHDYETGEVIRPASMEEYAASVAAARHDGGAGVIDVDGRRCYAI